MLGDKLKRLADLGRKSEVRAISVVRLRKWLDRNFASGGRVHGTGLSASTFAAKGKVSEDCRAKLANVKELVQTPPCAASTQY